MATGDEVIDLAEVEAESLTLRPKPMTLDGFVAELTGADSHKAIEFV
jgi:hypothetical protein